MKRFLPDPGTWINKPDHAQIEDGVVEITTKPGTDLWQRTYYGFRNDNAPMYVWASADAGFSFSFRCSFEYAGLFDQCGVVAYSDSRNWFKASAEYENSDLSRLGSVVTNNGYSDWATTDIATPRVIHYRLSRRGPDLLVESSPDGGAYSQMRVFHFGVLGDLSDEIAEADVPGGTSKTLHFGVYACSPTTSSFVARFDQISFGDCVWRRHAG